MLEESKKGKTLPDERYDQKLFKQACKAAKEAKELEKKLKKKRQRLRIILFTLIPIVLVLIGYLIVTLIPSRLEYVEAKARDTHPELSVLGVEELLTPIGVDITVTNLSAESAVVFNPINGDILFEKESKSKKYIASLTKILSAIVVIENYDMESVVAVSLENIPEDLDWQLGLKEGDKITVKNLLKAMLLSSYNDTAFIIANAYPFGGYNAFIKEMNSKALQLKMNDSSFSNPAGLDEELNYSTAMDVAKLISVARKYDEIYSTVSQGSETINWNSEDGLKSKVIYTTNQLYGVNPYSKGFKTGITNLAGQCFGGYFVYPNGNELVVVVLKSEDRFTDTAVLEKLSRVVLK